MALAGVPVTILCFLTIRGTARARTGAGSVNFTVLSVPRAGVDRPTLVKLVDMLDTVDPSLLK